MHFSDLASTVVVIALVSFFGLILGKIKIKSFSLGIGGVLFAGIIVAWSFKNYLGVDLNEGSYFPQTLHFVQEFGLILLSMQSATRSDRPSSRASSHQA